MQRQGSHLDTGILRTGRPGRPDVQSSGRPDLRPDVRTSRHPDVRTSGRPDDRTIAVSAVITNSMATLHRIQIRSKVVDWSCKSYFWFADQFLNLTLGL